jgi:hypothetical protein
MRERRINGRMGRRRGRRRRRGRMGERERERLVEGETISLSLLFFPRQSVKLQTRTLPY